MEALSFAEVIPTLDFSLHLVIHPRQPRFSGDRDTAVSPEVEQLAALCVRYGHIPGVHFDVGGTDRAGRYEVRLERAGQPPVTADFAGPHRHAKFEEYVTHLLKEVS